MQDGDSSDSFSHKKKPKSAVAARIREYAGHKIDHQLGKASETMQAGNGQIDIEALVRDHHGDVFRYARRLCGQVSDAQDVTQQTFLLAQQKLCQLRDPTRARSWLLAISRNCFLKEFSRRRPQSASAVELELEQACIVPAPDTIDQEALQLALDELPEEFRVVVLMFYFEFLSYQQIAEQLEIPIGTVMSRLSRGKKQLRERLNPESY